MNRTAVKKSVLFILAIVLLIVFVLQVSISGRTKISVLSVKKDIDTITIEKKSDLVRLEKIDGKWKVSSNDDPQFLCDVAEYSVNSIVDSITSLRLLGTVSSGGASRVQRYGLDSDSKIYVNAYGKGKVLRSIAVGKNSSSGNKCYIQVDGKKSVVIADTSLHTIFDKTLPSLREKNLYNISSDSISSVSIKKSGVEFEILLSLVEMKDETESSGIQININPMTEWTVAKHPEGMEDAVLNQGAVGTWIADLASVDVSQWCEKDVTLPEKEPDIVANIAVGGMMYSIDMYLDEQEDKYLCSTNRTKGLFYISKANAESIAKNLDDLIVKFEVPVVDEQ